MPSERDDQLRLLLVEDHVDSRIAITAYLGRICSVVEAGTVHEARQKLKLEPFDMILSDVHLPDGTGWDILRGLEQGSPAFAVSMSAHSRVDVEPQCRAAGFQKHLQKPLEPDALDEVITEAKTRSRRLEVAIASRDKQMADPTEGSE